MEAGTKMRFVLHRSGSTCLSRLFTVVIIFAWFFFYTSVIKYGNITKTEREKKRALHPPRARSFSLVLVGQSGAFGYLAITQLCPEVLKTVFYCSPPPRLLGLQMNKWRNSNDFMEMAVVISLTTGDEK